RLVVTFIPAARAFLLEHCGLAPEQVVVLWHGAPLPPPLDRPAARQRLHLAGRTVLTTYGLLTRFKGIEEVLQALPPLVARDAQLLYLILGRPHPSEPAAYYRG